MIGAGAAVDYLSNIGMKNIKNRVNHLWTFLREELAPYKDEFEILGEDNLENNNGIMTLFFKRKGVVNCLEENLRGIDNILNAKRNIMVRSGEYCAHSWFHENEIDRRSEKIRVSLYFYNTEEECRAFASSLGDIIKSWEYQALPFLNQKKII
jgi:selenocysteine lyase/cysteine desulfurase